MIKTTVYMVICPKCKSKNIASILWGEILLTAEGKNNRENGKIVLGGCCVSENDPDKECNDCFHRW